MKSYAGYPVEIIVASVDGQEIEVGVVYQWASGDRRTRWHYDQISEQTANLRYIPYEESA